MINPPPSHWYDIGGWLGWMAEEIKLILLWLLDGVLSGVVSLISAVPMPGWVQQSTGLTFPSSVAWFASAFEIKFGLIVIASAYGIRFFIRRLPFIG